MFQVGIIASGSRGNSIVVRTEKGAVLVDAGLSGKAILKGLNELGIVNDEVVAVVISHEHSDHIKGAGIICRKLDIPLFISRETYSISAAKLGKLPKGAVFFSQGSGFEIADMVINPFTSSHDAVDSSNFFINRINDPVRKLGIATDCGYFTRLMKERLQDCTTLVLESNHDEVMLLQGSYPWDRKQRIKSRQGHLSNRQAVSVISQIIHPEMKQLILAHLSENNNTPALAENEMNKYLQLINHKLDLYVASQNNVIKLLDV